MTRPLRLPTLAALALALALAGCTRTPEVPEALLEEGPEALAALAVRVPSDTTEAHGFYVGGGDGAFYYGSLTRADHRAEMGVLAGGFRLADGWRWWLASDSSTLGPQHRRAGAARPDFAVRVYAPPDTAGLIQQALGLIQREARPAITERVSAVPGGVLVEVPDSLGGLALFPTFSDRREASGYAVLDTLGTLLVQRTNYRAPRGTSRRPVWLAVRSTTGRTQMTEVPGVDSLGFGAHERALVLGGVFLDTPGAVAFAYGMTKDEALQSAARITENAAALRERRAARLASALEGPGIETEDERFNRALAWARLGLEQLALGDSAGVQVTRGLPGIEPAPARNVIGVLPALLALGQWDRARALLLTYGRAQNRDSRLNIFGRVPTAFDDDGRPVFSSADATAAWVAAVGDYLRVTGQEQMVRSNPGDWWTRTVYATRGIVNEAMTPQGFLRTPEGQTWLQAGPGRNPYVRAPAAVEAQGRYYRDLQAMARLARIMGQISGRPTSVEAYTDSARALQARFERAYVRDGGGGPAVADYLDARGQPQFSARPAVLDALRDFDLDPDAERRILRETAERLAYPWGVATLAQDDSTFHPFLDAPEYYEPAAARYSGAIWTALSGPLVSLLVQHGAPGRAYEQTEALTELLLERGMVGGIPDNVDPHPRAAGGRPALGGAPLQPFSLAAYVRNAFEDYAGVGYASGTEATLTPHLPEAWGETAVTFRLGGGLVRATMRQSGGALVATLGHAGGTLPTGAAVRVRAFGLEALVPLVRQQGDTLTVPVGDVRVEVTADGVEVGGERAEPDGRYAVADPAFWDGFEWVEPELQDRYPVMRLVEQARQLSEAQVARDNPTALPRLAQTDPAGDDWGQTGTYTYPTSFPPGILDAIYLEVSEDDSTYYFRIETATLARADSFGYQPTFLALAIDTEEGGATRVGRNAHYDLAANDAYEYVIFVGDGLLVEDARGRTLASFPQLGASLVDDTAAGVILFALPKFVIERLPRGAGLTLLVGARAREEDAFRTVQSRAGEAYGGGKLNDRGPNVYDVITATAE